MNLKKLILSACALLCICQLSIADKGTFGGTTTTSSLHYSLDACQAFVNAGTLADYSEFVGVPTNDPACTTLTPIGTVCRANPADNPHSCTPGVNGTNGMCVSADESCNYTAGDNKSLKFDVMLTPGPSGTGTLSGISFYENAPATYVWNQGPSGLNNYPTLYGIRVLKDGTEIFSSSDNATTNGWTLEEFSFSDPAFTVTQPAVFTFELLGYCPINNGGTVSVWDIDEITVTSVCSTTTLDGGSLATADGETELSICANDGISDAFDVVITGATGSNSAWVITDANGDILALPTAPPFDLEGAGTGICFIWHLTYDTIDGATVGANVNGLTGCFALSNPIVVNRNQQGGGSLVITSTGGTETSICVDGVPDPIDVTLTGSTASNNVWVITDLNANILALPAGPPFDLDGAGLGTCLIWNLGHDGGITGAAVGNNVSDIVGCYGLSNSITIVRTTASAGTISSNGATEVSICSGDGVPDLIDATVTGNAGSNSAWVITDANGIIRDLPSGPPFDLDGGVSGSCQIWHVSYDGTINGLTVGGSAAGISGCFGLSNPITVTKERTGGGVLSSSNLTFINVCEGDGSSNVIDFVLNNNQGANVQYFITDANGNITQLVSGVPIDFSPFATGRYSVYALSYNGASSGVMVGQNVSSLSGGCNGLSNPVTIAKEAATGGTISSPSGDNFVVCVQGNVTEDINVSVSGNLGSFSRWIVTDTNGNIIALPGAPPINIQVAGPQTCQIWHLSYEPSFSGLVVGNNVSAFTGCHDLSNPITVNKTIADGGVIATTANTTSIDICTNNGTSTSVTTVLNGNVGDNFQWVVTDTDNNILDLPTGSPIDFSSYGNGSYRIWHLAFNGAINGATVGSNAGNITGDCFDLSNFIAVNIAGASAGTITSPFGDNFDICMAGISDPIDFSVSGNSGNGRWVITDTAGNITDLPGASPFNVNTSTGTSQVWWLAFDSGISGLAIGNNVSGLDGCFSLSNAITVNSSNVSGGNIGIAGGGTEIEICVDGVSDAFDVTLSGNTGANNAWVITDANGNILDLPAGPPFDLDGAGVGTCLIWNVSYDGTLTGAAVGNNASDLAGCFALSNPITVVRTQKDAGMISTNGVTEVNLCINSGSTTVDVQTSGGNNVGTAAWVITDANGVILDLPTAPPFDFAGAGTGTCLIWRACYAAGTTGLTVGASASDISGCFDLSNPITVIRSEFDADGETTSTYVFNLDACYSQTDDQSGCDYSEFKGVTTNDGACTQFSPSGDGCVYRNNPTVNKHSCTPGVNGTNAMCISSLNSCMFVANADPALRFEVTVAPGVNGTGNISSLSFYEKAPLMFEWINGATGINNYPTLYGLRVLKNGTEIFVQANLATTNDWTLESFDFSSNPDFSVTTSTVFSFELLPYCTIGNGAAVNAWDIDEITLSSSCMGATTIMGGNLTTAGGATEMEICAGDGVSDAFDVNLEMASGPNSAWVITDADGNILDLPAGPPFDFEGAGAGVCLVWHLSYANGLTGAAVGNNASQLEGCFELSNPITVTRLEGADCTSPINGGGTIDEEDIEAELPELVSDFKVMPNPASEMLKIQTDVVPMEGTKVYIYDRMGQMVEKRNLTTQTLEVNLINFTEGYYFIKVISGPNEMSNSFIKYRQ